MNQYLTQNKDGQMVIMQSNNRALIGDTVIAEIPKFNGQPVLDVDVLDIEKKYRHIESGEISLPLDQEPEPYSVSGEIYHPTAYVTATPNPDKITAKMADRMEQQLEEKKLRLLASLEQIKDQKLKSGHITYNNKKLSCSPDMLLNILGQHKLIEMGIKTDATLTQTTGVRSTFNKSDLEQIGVLISSFNDSIMATYAKKLKAIHSLSDLNTEVDLKGGW